MSYKDKLIGKPKSNREFNFKILVFPNITYSKDIRKDSYIVVLDNVIRQLNEIRPDIFWTILTPQWLYEFDHDNVEQIEITGMWGNILKPGETHPPHTHSNNFLSGVFYLESDAETGIIFSDPRPAADVLVPRKKTKTNENSNLLSYISKQNRLIIFPSWLVHWVPINKSKRDRISISFNIQIKGQVGEHHEFQSAKY